MPVPQAPPSPTTLIGFLVVVLVAVAFQFTPLASALDDRLLDGWFRTLRAVSPTPAAAEIVVVGIDEETFRSYREPEALWHPHLGKLFSALAAGKPSVVGLDVVLPDKSYDFLVPGNDRKLLSGLLALKRVAPVVLAQTVDERGVERALFGPIVSVAGGDPLGLVVVKPDADRTVRRYSTVLHADSGEMPTLAGNMASRLGMPGPGGIIDFATGDAFDYVPMQQLIAWNEVGDTQRLRATLEDKAVLVGAILPFVDRHFLPVDLAAWEPGNRFLPGVFIHAQALRSLTGEGLIQQVSEVWILLLAAVATLVWWPAKRALPGLAIAALTVAALLAVALFALTRGIHLPVAGICLALLLALAARLTLESAIAAGERKRLRSAFGGYVSPGVMNEILTGRLKPGIGGERRRVCVLFSDIRSFTTRSESQPPEAIIALLNDYFDEMTSAVHLHHGTVDKFIGDGLMCFFGAPGDPVNTSRSAFDAAREMLTRLDRLNREFATRDIEAVRIGVGLHVGDAVVGHVGSEARHEYTVIGDTVNISARLEGLTKELGYPIVCSGEVAAELGPDAGLVDLGPQAVKGRAAVHVYGWRGEHAASE